MKMNRIMFIALVILVIITVLASTIETGNIKRSCKYACPLPLTSIRIPAESIGTAHDVYVYNEAESKLDPLDNYRKEYVTETVSSATKASLHSAWNHCKSIRYTPSPITSLYKAVGSLFGIVNSVNPTIPKDASFVIYHDSRDVVSAYIEDGMVYII